MNKYEYICVNMMCKYHLSEYKDTLLLLIPNKNKTK